MLLLWNLLITVLWPLLYFYPPFRGTVNERLGHFELGSYDPDSAGLRVLINAVSAGEVVAIAPFIRELRGAQPDMQVVLLTTTESGIQMAASKLDGQAELVAYFPLADLPWVTARYLDRLRPHVYMTTEAELWPNMETQCRRRGIRTALVNARLYLHNKRGLRGWLVRGLLRMLDLIVCQDERQRDNFVRFGIEPGKLAVSGNMKFDFELPQWTDGQLAGWRGQFGLAEHEPLIVAGSTHPGEEELVLDAAGKTRLILAPRHVEHAEDVMALAQARGKRTLRLSEHQPGAQWDVLVVDSYGVLVDFYRLASVVIMGGTFNPKVGGHNILEATALGKPVIVGPYVYSITAQVEMLATAGALAQAANAAELRSRAAELLANPGLASAIGEVGRQVTLKSRGAARRAACAILDLAGIRG